MKSLKPGSFSFSAKFWDAPNPRRVPLMHVCALSGEYYILADLLRWLNEELCADSAQVPLIRHWAVDEGFAIADRFAFRSWRSDMAAVPPRRASATIANVFLSQRFCLNG